MIIRLIHSLALAATAILTLNLMDAHGGAFAQTIGPAARTPITTPSHFFKRYLRAVTNCSIVYTVPENKVLIVQSIVYNLSKININTPTVSALLFSDTCSQGYLDGGITTLPVESINHIFGTGLAVASGQTLAVSASGASADVIIVGYLIDSDGIKIAGSTGIASLIASAVSEDNIGGQTQRLQPTAESPQTTPSNFLVKFAHSDDACSGVYTVPPRKVLIIQSITYLIFHTAQTIADIDLFGDAACSQIEDIGQTTRLAESVHHVFGAGLAVPGGSTLSAFAGTGNGPTYKSTMIIVGYLVPADGVKILDPSSSD